MYIYICIYIIYICPYIYIYRHIYYTGTVTETTSNNHEAYVGLTENEFKTRLNLHKSSFKLEHKRTSTTLSDHVWKLKNKNIDFNTKWGIVKKVKSFTPSEKVSKLCFQEKFSILRSAPSLNKTYEIFGHCMDKNRFQLNHTTIYSHLMRVTLIRNSDS